MLHTKNEECILLSSSKSYKKDASSDKSCSKTLIVSWVRSILSSQVYFAQLRFLHVTQQASIWRRKKHMLLSKHIWRTISIVQILFYSNSNAKSCKLRSLIWRFFFDWYAWFRMWWIIIHFFYRSHDIEKEGQESLHERQTFGPLIPQDFHRITGWTCQPGQ